MSDLGLTTGAGSLGKSSTAMGRELMQAQLSAMRGQMTKEDIQLQKCFRFISKVVVDQGLPESVTQHCMELVKHLYRGCKENLIKLQLTSDINLLGLIFHVTSQSPDAASRHQDTLVQYVTGAKAVTSRDIQTRATRVKECLMTLKNDGYDINLDNLAAAGTKVSASDLVNRLAMDLGMFQVGEMAAYMVDQMNKTGMIKLSDRQASVVACVILSAHISNFGFVTVARAREHFPGRERVEEVSVMNILRTAMSANNLERIFRVQEHNPKSVKFNRIWGKWVNAEQDKKFRSELKIDHSVVAAPPLPKSSPLTVAAPVAKPVVKVATRVAAPAPKRPRN
jgi:hypothetical protein